MNAGSDASSAGRNRSRTAVFLGFVCCLAGLTGCQVSAEADPTPIPTSLPTVTPTSSVTFQVAVTPIAVRKHHTIKPTPQPTRFVIPSGPYIVLHPNSGPPVDRSIVVIGGNFPHNAPVTIQWALTRRLTPLSTTGNSDRRGTFRISLSVPASAPGVYGVQAQVGGVPYAHASYHIVSSASLAASIVPTSSGGTLSIVGKKFVPGFKLTLIAYSTVSGREPIILGSAQVNEQGRFAFARPLDRLQPGQYILRAWSESSVAAEMAQTFFEVVV